VSWPALLAALASAACFAAAAALQHHAGSQQERAGALDPRLVARLARQPLWLLGTVCDGTAVGLQALALALGPLSLVEPLLTAGLFLAVPFEAALDRRRPRRRELAAVGLAMAGLLAFLLTAVPRDGTGSPSAPAWVAVLAGVGVLCAAALLVGSRLSPAGRATCLGLASGLLIGVTAGLFKNCLDLLARHPLGLLTSWPLYALVALGAVGFVLSQTSLQDTMAAPLIAMTVTEPVVGLVVGLAVFHERVASSGPRAVVLALAGALMAVGVGLAATSPERAAPPAPGRLGDEAPAVGPATR
jgi:drug/metabolite transporter (DMT)-like permease